LWAAAPGAERSPTHSPHQARRSCSWSGGDFLPRDLYLADASIFPSIGAVNPALTVMANAIRVGDHITGRLR